MPDGATDGITCGFALRNFTSLPDFFGECARALRPGGRFFMHVFCHRSVPYAFVESDPSDWMSRHFFSGGMMPSDGLPLRFQDRLILRRQWRWAQPKWRPWRRQTLLR